MLEEISCPFVYKLLINDAWRITNAYTYNVRCDMIFVQTWEIFNHQFYHEVNSPVSVQVKFELELKNTHYAFITTKKLSIGTHISYPSILPYTAITKLLDKVSCSCIYNVLFYWNPCKHHNDCFLALQDMGYREAAISYLFKVFNKLHEMT